MNQIRCFNIFHLIKNIHSITKVLKKNNILREIFNEEKIKLIKAEE